MTQYTTTCLDDGCDYKYHDPNERSALSRLRDHVEETGHEVALQGEYDKPTKGGVHGPDGRRDITPEDIAPGGPLSP